MINSEGYEQQQLGPVNTNRLVTVALENTPIKARGAWFGYSYYARQSNEASSSGVEYRSIGVKSNEGFHIFRSTPEFL